MKFTFDYYEYLVRRVVIDADSLSEAIKEIEDQIEKEKLVLAADDFYGAEIKMPLKENFLPRLEYLGDSVEGEDYDLVVDIW